MVKLDKIYTRGGDKGLTSLGNGQRVSKHSLRVVSYGDIDEVNAVIGILINHCSTDLKKNLSIIQNDLFDIGADLCMPDVSNKKKLKLNPEQVVFLEREIDVMNKSLDDLESFILPGGTIASCYLHFARCVVRRSERSLSNLNEYESVNREVFKYVNRLSDFFFVAARYENRNIGDTLWEPGKFQK